MASICGYDSMGSPRKAAAGYDCTVLPALSLWGFCPTTVIVASDCGLFGYCYDSKSCSTGCGPYPSSSSVTFLTVITCPESQTCSFLNSDNGGGQIFSNIACGDSGGTVTLYPTPPSVAASTTSIFISATTSSILTKSTTIPTSTSSTSPTMSIGSSFISTSRHLTTNIANITPTTSSLSTTATSTSATNHTTPPYGPIIGGALGGLAILCLTVLAVFLIRRRNASSGRNPPSYPHADAPVQDSYYDKSFNRSQIDDLYGHQFQKPQEIGRTYTLHEAQANRDPAELPS